jgi:hypothetical protein
MLTRDREQPFSAGNGVNVRCALACVPFHRDFKQAVPLAPGWHLEYNVVHPRGHLFCPRTRPVAGIKRQGF